MSSPIPKKKRKPRRRICLAAPPTILCSSNRNEQHQLVASNNDIQPNAKELHLPKFEHDDKENCGADLAQTSHLPQTNAKELKLQHQLELDDKVNWDIAQTFLLSELSASELELQRLCENDDQENSGFIAQKLHRTHSYAKELELQHQQVDRDNCAIAQSFLLSQTDAIELQPQFEHDDNKNGIHLLEPNAKELEAQQPFEHDDKENCGGGDLAQTYHLPSSTTVHLSTIPKVANDKKSLKTPKPPYYRSRQVQVCVMDGFDDDTDPSCIAQGYEYLVDESNTDGVITGYHIQNIWIVKQPGYNLQFRGKHVEATKNVDYEDAIMLEVSQEDMADLGM